MKSIDQAFKKCSRPHFVPKEYKDVADLDTALPIGYGQTISQPTVVASMLEWLDVEPGTNVLDVGSGSGWTSALLSYLVGPKGKITATELVPELLDFGKNNVESLGIKNVKFYLASRAIGWPAKAPYKAILVSAAAKELSKELIKQLDIGGKMVIPVNNDILEISKESKSRIETIKHPGYVFVPLL
jgi:protein-L-isoaspartate(D-aspartate) O-methyltransferase